jgi:hypothetical protein
MLRTRGRAGGFTRLPRFSAPNFAPGFRGRPSRLGRAVQESGCRAGVRRVSWIDAAAIS